MDTEANRRIARNTIYLYLRTFVTMGIGLYTSRKILEALGIDDYGVYNLVGGIIVILSFLSGSMVMAIQRYLTVELGKRDLEAYNRVFNTSIIIQAGLALALLILAETVGLWFVNERLAVAPERLWAANWVYQAAVVSTMLSILTSPFTATITAHERMNVYAYIGLSEAAAKLLIVMLLFRVPWDRLSTWAIMLCLITLASGLFQLWYCRHSFPHCRLTLRHDRSIIRSMAGFSGWNLFGTLAWTMKDQGLNLLINIFSGGTAINAARGIAMQVRTAITGLMSGFQNAVSPQLVKNYAADERSAAFRLMFASSKISFFLLLIPALPVCFEATFLLGLWLVKVPDYAALFTILVIIETLCDVFATPTINLLMATGRIKWYQIIVGSLMLLNIPISYLLLLTGMPIYIPFIVSILIVIICQTARLLIARHQTQLPLPPYLTRVILVCLIVTILSIIPTGIVFCLMSPSWLRLIAVTATALSATTLSVWFVGLSKGERQFVKQLITSKFQHRQTINP